MTGSSGSIVRGKYAVLDTNAVLDWLVFDGPVARPMKEAILDGRLIPLTNTACFAELERVLSYAKLRVETPRREAVLTAYRNTALWIEPSLPASGTPQKIPRCRDPDDQKFLELAVTGRAAYLISRDARVLGTARRMEAAFGVRVLNTLKLAEELQTTCLDEAN